MTEHQHTNPARDDGYSGEHGGVDDQRRLAAEHPSGTVAARPQDAGGGNGSKASFDPTTGATRGSGRGSGEDLDTDNPTIHDGKQGSVEG